MLWSTFPDIQAQLEWAGCPPPTCHHILSAAGPPTRGGW